MQTSIRNLVPYAHVADVSRSMAFYELLGFGVVRTIPGIWAYLKSENAELMLARASGPIVAEQQAVLFYMYADSVSTLRTHLLAQGVPVSAIQHPDHMAAGEIRLADPDGYVILIGQLA